MIWCIGQRARSSLIYYGEYLLRQGVWATVLVDETRQGHFKLLSEQTYKIDVRYQRRRSNPAARRSLGKLGNSCPSSWECSRAQFLNTSRGGRVLAFLMRMRLVAERCRVPDGPERPMR